MINNGIVGRISLYDLPAADKRRTEVPRSGQTQSGYGKRIPTQHMIRHNGKWRRVYCCIYSNIGTCYITDKNGDWIVVGD